MYTYIHPYVHISIYSYIHIYIYTTTNLEVCVCVLLVPCECHLVICRSMHHCRCPCSLSAQPACLCWGADGLQGQQRTLQDGIFYTSPPTPYRSIPASMLLSLGGLYTYITHIYVIIPTHICTWTYTQACVIQAHPLITAVFYSTHVFMKKQTLGYAFKKAEVT